MASARDYLVQCTASALEGGNSWSDININLPHPTLAGNCLVIFFQVGTATTATITDDKGNTWPAATASRSSSQFLYCYVLPNAITGTRVITIAFGAAKLFFQAACYEFCYIKQTSPVDGTTVDGVGSSSTVTAGSYSTLSAANDLLLQYVLQDGVSGWNGTSFLPSTIEPDWELLHTDVWDGTASQYMIWDSTAALTPTMTMSGQATTWITIAIALQTDRALGTPLPAGVTRVRRRQFRSTLVAGNLTMPLQFPSNGGGCAVISAHAWNSNASDHSVTTIVDVNSKTLPVAAAQNQFLSGGSQTNESIWYDAEVSGNNRTLTITYANAINEATAAVYDVVGIDPGHPIGTTLTNTGSQADGNAAGDVSTGTFAPTRAQSDVIGLLPIEIGTITGVVTPATTAYDQFISTGMNGGFNHLEEDNGHMTYVTPTSASFTMDWKTSRPNGAGNGIGNWGQVLVEFMPPVPRYAVMSALLRRKRAQFASEVLK